MPEKATKPSHVSTPETLWEDMGFTPEEAAVLELKYTLHSEIEKEIKRQKLTPKEVGRVLDIQQPHVSDLLRGKISKVTTDRLTKYLSRLGRQVKVTTRKARVPTGRVQRRHSTLSIK